MDRYLPKEHIRRMKKNTQATLMALAVTLTLFACTGSKTHLADATIAGTDAKELPVIQDQAPEPDWNFPKSRSLGADKIVIHAPQIVKWSDFSHFEALMAVEVNILGEDEPILASLLVSGKTSVKLNQRIVIVTEPVVESVTFVNDGTVEVEERLKGAMQRNRLEIPVDIFLYSLATGAVDLPQAEGLSDQPPTIKVAKTPTLLLFINGDPVRKPIEETSLELVINANWPTVFDAGSKLYYLLNKNAWQQAAELSGPWSSAKSLPPEMKAISTDGQFAEIRAAYPLQPSSSELPAIFHATEPTELIVIDGEPKLEAIAGAEGLTFVNNTRSPLFNLEQTYYFLTSGRWFSTLDFTAWQLVTELPDQFSLIPEDHGMAYVRSSVAGTIESKLAILEALLPTEKTVDKEEKLTVDAKFDGEPEFQPVANTGVSRAVNTQLNIIEYQQVYYLCYEGAWYQADSPVGPWAVAYRVPEAIYDIPASSPSYPVTQVQVASTTPSSVTYSYTQGYSSGIYISYGIPVYGTGWYYPPYYGFYYYPWFMSYGHGNFYNPNTGRYTTRSVWAGPYGGYSYNQFTNPNTGRYGFVETAWDGDEWASYGESYNPRTRVYTETERYYSDDNERFSMERDISRDGKSLHTEREVDIDGGWSETVRQTSEGGSSVVTRHRQEDGSIIKEGNVTAADGRTAEISGVYEDGKSTTTITGSEGREGTIERSRDASGVSREGTFTNESGETLNTSTKRDGRDTTTRLDSSSGGEAISRSDGDSRKTVARDSSGDLYASRDGNVYKKGDDGWQEFDRDNNRWQQAGSRETERSSSDRISTTAKSRESLGGQRGTGSRDGWDAYNRNSSQLQRDARSRQRGYDQFHKRRSASSRQFSRSQARPAGGRRGRR
jgi:hypothetical protein